MANPNPLIIVVIFGLCTILAIWTVGRMTKRYLAGGDAARKPGARDALTQVEVDAIVSRGLATPAELFTMDPDKQRILAQTALMLVTAAQGLPTAGVPAAPPETFCPHCAAPVTDFPPVLPWRATCRRCGTELVLRRDGPRLLLSYRIKSTAAPAGDTPGMSRRTSA